MLNEGKICSKPPPRTAIVFPLLSSAVLWAIVSTPAASPLTIVKLFSQSPRVNFSVTIFPYGVGVLVPTTPMQSVPRSETSPRQKSV